ncbi:MAG: hypothetical protein HFE27_03530 [Clostridia bacterium]|nr:hypothetical protein [Clostridia bacterium]
MKHFTKEWYILEQLSYLDWQMKQAKHAERKDESTFQTFYRYRLEIYSSFERNSDLYRNPKDDLLKLDEFCNDPYITKTERKERERFRRMFLYLNRRLRQSARDVVIKALLQGTSYQLQSHSQSGADRNFPCHTKFDPTVLPERL